VDSGGDLTQEMAQRLGAETVPLSMLVEGREYVDSFDLDVNAFLTASEKSSEVTRTACPAPAAYAALYEGEEEIYVVTLTSKLSGSHAAAIAGKALSANGERVHVFDSGSAASGPLLVTLKLRQFLDEGLPREEVIQKTEAFIEEMETIFVLEDVSALVKNGRMSRLAGKLVTALSIRPILAADHGEIVQLDKARGSAAALQKLADHTVRLRPDSRGRIACISHCFNPDAAAQLKARLEELCAFDEIHIQQSRGLSSFYAGRYGVVLAF